MTVKKRLRIMILSDGTGRTAKDLVRASLRQFPDNDVVFTIKKNIRSEEQLEQIFLEAQAQYDLMVYTFVQKEVREYFDIKSKLYTVPTLDLLGPLLNKMSTLLESEPNYSPGLLRSPDREYFEKISALEFTLKHDDGNNLDTLNEADIILVGISRTSKTPLAVFLSLEGLKVINIPVNFHKDLPPEIYKVDQKKIFGLTIKPEALQDIRRNRVEINKPTDKDRDYTEIDQITQEVFWAEQIFERNKLWPVLDITNISLEEIASEVLKLLEMRLKNFKKHSLRFK